MRQFERILVRATNWVGDAVMSLAALHALRAANPQAHISILAKSWVADLYGREPFCDEVIPYDVPPDRRAIGPRWRVVQDLKTRRFDAAVLLQNAFEAAAIVWAARIPVRIGYNRDGRGLLLTTALPVPKSGEIHAHQRFYYLELLKRAGLIGGYSDDVESLLTGATEAAESGRRHFATLGINGPVLGVSPGAAYGGAKRWLPDRFAESAVRLARTYGCSVAFFGSEAEAELCEAIAAQVKAQGVTSMNFSGRTTLREFINMAAACRLYLTNDSGPMHIASACGVPTVAVFGSTDSEATGPAGNRFAIVRHPVECSPCLLRECPIDHRCMTRVSVDQVVEATARLLA